MDGATHYFSFNAKKIVGSMLLESLLEPSRRTQWIGEDYAEVWIQGCIGHDCSTDKPSSEGWGPGESLAAARREKQGLYNQTQLLWIKGWLISLD